MDETEDETPLAGTDGEMKELLGLYDAPAFARRGLDLEYALARIDARCRREREAMLEMVRLRLRQWAAVASGPATALEVFAAPIDDLWPLADAPPPAWADRPAPPRKLRSVARDLVASVQRFNRRWERFLGGLDFEPVNRLDRPLQSLLCAREGMHAPLGPPGGPALRAEAAGLARGPPRTLSDPARARAEVGPARAGRVRHLRDRPRMSGQPPRPGRTRPARRPYARRPMHRSERSSPLALLWLAPASPRTRRPTPRRGRRPRSPSR